MSRISRRTVRHGWVLYAGCFVAVAVGVFLLGLAAGTIAAGTAYLHHHPGGVPVTVTGDGTTAHTERYRPDDQSPEGLLALLGLVSFTCGFMTIFIVASTFAFVVAARRRELGLLRLVGATPRQIRRMVLGEALIVAVVASAAGALAAHLVLPVLLDLTAGTRFNPVRLDPPDPVPPLAIASGIGVVTALIGARLSARRAARVTPVDALRESATEPPRLTVGRVVVGLLGLAGAGTMTAFIRPGNLEVAAAMAILVPMVSVIGLVPLAPLLVPPVTRLWWLVIRRAAGVPGHLAGRNVWAAPRRTASLAAPILAIATIAGTLAVMMDFVGDLTYAQDLRVARPSLVVTADGTDVDHTDVDRTDPGRTAAGLAGRLRATPGVDTVDVIRPLQVVLTDRGSAVGAAAAGIDPVTFARVRRLDVRNGSLDRLRGPTVAMIESQARDYGYHLGDPVRLSFLDGTAMTLTLVAVVADAPNLVPPLMLPDDLLDRHSPPTPPGQWVVLPDTGTDLDHLVREVRDRIGAATVDETDAWLRARLGEFRRTNDQVLLIILGPAGGYAGIAIVNTLLIGNLRRRREFVAARLIGATPRQIRQMILYESVLIGVAALSIAGAVTVLVTLLARRAMMTGVHPVTTTVSWPTLGGIAVLCVGLAAVAAVAPAIRVLRDANPSSATVVD